MSNWIKSKPIYFLFFLGIILISASLMALQKSHEKPYEEATPYVSQSIDDFTINPENNDCLDCHQEGEKIVEDHIAIKVPPSSLQNESSGEQTQNQVPGIRYNCLRCHRLQIKKESSSSYSKK
ncbi:nitrate reductase cytochrome c-type subunit [Acidobacteriota bacterium]